MSSPITPSSPHSGRFAPAAQLVGAVAFACALVLLAVGPQQLLAQIEGDRGIAPVASTGDIEIGGIDVNTTGRTAAEARRNGWREAAKLAWAKPAARSCPTARSRG